MGIVGFGTEQVTRDFEGFAQSLPAHVMQAMEKWLNTVVLPKAKLRAPAKSGLLRNSLAIVRVIKGANTISFIVGWGSRAEYGKYQERGTRFMAAKQFMLTSVMDSGTQLKSTWIKQIRISEVNKYLKKGLETFTFRPSFA